MTDFTPGPWHSDGYRILANGGLKWEDVKPILEEELSWDCFRVITNEH